MRIEIILFLITAFIVGNIYTEGKLVKIALSWKKYYKMAGVIVGALFIYWVFKKNPMSSKQMIATTNEYLKYMPIDSETSQFISPILDFTSKQNFFGDADFLRGQTDAQITRIMKSGHGPGYGPGHGPGSGRPGKKKHIKDEKTKKTKDNKNKKIGAAPGRARRRDSAPRY